MISVAKALDILKDQPLPVAEVKVPFMDAVNHVLYKNIVADRDFPPFDRVTMDGIAIAHDAFASGQREFSVAGTVAAGTAQTLLSDKERCLEVMTGAILPKGCDTIIRYEDVTINNGVAKCTLNELQLGANVHHRGSDRTAGSTIVPAPTVLSPAEIAIAATVGLEQLAVVKLPKAVVVSTGDELVPVSAQPAAHQIRASNAYTLKVILEEMGLEADETHLRDDRAEVLDTLRQLVDDYQIIILIGGSSKGKFDYIPECLRELGLQEHFYRVKQRPGKPFMFATREDRNFVFALPGNPVSCFLCLQYYFKYWLAESLGIAETLPTAILDRDIDFHPPLTYFLQVKLASDAGTLRAMPSEGRGSGDLANLVDADAFLMLPDDRSHFRAGEVYPYILYRQSF